MEICHVLKCGCNFVIFIMVVVYSEVYVCVCMYLGRLACQLVIVVMLWTN